MGIRSVWLRGAASLAGLVTLLVALLPAAAAPARVVLSPGGRPATPGSSCGSTRMTRGPPSSP
jgi:hypothetical protein